MSLVLKITMTWETKCMWGREDWCEICLVYIDGLLDLSLSEVHCTCVYIEERKKKVI